MESNMTEIFTVSRKPDTDESRIISRQAETCEDKTILKIYQSLIDMKDNEDKQTIGTIAYTLNDRPPFRVSKVPQVRVLVIPFQEQYNNRQLPTVVC